MSLAPDATPLKPWRYGQWRMPTVCEGVDTPHERDMSSTDKA